MLASRDQSQFAIFFQVHNLLPVAKCHQKSCNIFRRGISGGVETCPAAECDTVNQWKCKDSWEIKRVFNSSLLVTIFSSRFVFFGRRENSWNYQKWRFSEWLWYTTGFDSGCWMIVACWDAIPAFWFFVLVICKGMLFYFKELRQRSQKSNMFGHHSGWVAMMWNNLIPNRSCHPFCETPPAILYRQKSS